MLVPQHSYAFEFKDLFLRPDQQGQHLLQRHHPAEAARHFENVQWQGIALYEAGDYAGAAQRFAQGNTAADHYNRGNALARSGELEAAIDAYEQALERQPEFPAAKANKALIEQMQEQNKQAAAEDASEGKSESEKDADNPSGGSSDQQQQSQQTSSQNAEENDSSASSAQLSGGSGTSDAMPDDDEPTRAPSRPADSHISGEQRQALEQWLRQIPDEPGELLRRKFWYEQQQHQEKAR
jgi:Ca-activated chloride channel family protein